MMHLFERLTLVFFAIATSLLSSAALAQWEHRYSKLSDFGHHVYLEQHELPILANGPTDPAPAPDGEALAFAAQGWLWLLDIENGTATQITDSADVDARPRWSPDGSQIAFVRDNGSDTSIVVLDLASGDETVINTPTIELDPEFSTDGESLFYTSGVGDKLSLWRRHLSSGVDAQLTDLRQVERNARRLASGKGLLYLHGAGAHRVLRVRDFVAGTDAVVHRETLTYHLSADAHPTQQLVVYSAPIDNAYHLWTMDLNDPNVTHRITNGARFALTPAFSADGNHIYYVEADEQRQFHLKRIATYGGASETLVIREWNRKTATGMLSLKINNTDDQPVTARVSLTNDDGHPVASPTDATYFDPQTGRYYFYVEGSADFSLPVGRYTATIARGPMAPIVQETIRVRANRASTTTVSPQPLWDANAAGYASADHHVHLNGDGHHRATHKDALRVMAGEDLDALAPMSWNRWQRRIDESLVGEQSATAGRVVRQGQEVRSHFHGHIGLAGVTQPFVPWFFGPYNPTLGDPDLTNGDVLAYAEATGAFPTYVHPIVNDDDPFEQLDESPIPLEMIADGVLAKRMGIEMVCAWTSPLGNAHVWYRLLNIGQPIAAMSGTDSWVDFHRTPAVGTGRTYARVDGDVTSSSVLAAAAAGKSFVTTGPALVFSMSDNIRPGETISSGTHTWQATLASTNAIDVVELIINGQVVSRHDGVLANEQKTLTGEITLPEGGWVALRAYASSRAEDAWPTMHARPFAHSSPIWIDTIGSTDSSARASAASDLISALDAAEREIRDAYGEVQTPKLEARFAKARAKLQAMISP
ncbi:MAG: CehA/McbA family metallohydrolase [Woeseiaceae bacterium]